MPDLRDFRIAKRIPSSKVSRKAFRNLSSDSVGGIPLTWTDRSLSFIGRFVSGWSRAHAHHVYDPLAMQRAYRAKRKARLRSSLPPQLWRAPPRTYPSPDTDSRDHNGGNDTASLASVNSSHPDANLDDFEKLLSDLISKARASEAIERNIDQIKEKLTGLQFRIEDLTASLRHVHRRDQDLQAKALNARQHARLDLQLADRQKWLFQLQTQEAELDRTLVSQTNNESRLCRAGGAFIRNAQREDPAGNTITAALKYQLRNLVDCSRAPRIGAGGPSSVDTQHANRRTVLGRNRTSGEYIMDQSFEALMQIRNHKLRMKDFLDLVESIQLEDAGLPPLEDGSTQQKGADDGSQDDEQRRQAAVVQVDAAITAMDKAQNDMQSLRNNYTNQKDLHHLAHEKDIPANDEVGDNPLYPMRPDHFEWLYRGRMTVAQRSARRAEAQHREAVNQALEAKVSHWAEDLLGVLDHENDGFTSTMGSTHQNELKVRSAGEKDRIDRWLSQARSDGRGYALPDVPSEVADVETGSDIRYGLSTRGQPIQFTSDLKARWAAEVIVMRAEAEKQRQEIYDRATGRP